MFAIVLLGVAIVLVGGCYGGVMELLGGCNCVAGCCYCIDRWLLWCCSVFVVSMVLLPGCYGVC